MPMLSCMLPAPVCCHPRRSVRRAHKSPIRMHRMYCVLFLLCIKLANPPFAAGSHAVVGMDALSQQCCCVHKPVGHPCTPELLVTFSLSSVNDTARSALLLSCTCLYFSSAGCRMPNLQLTHLPFLYCAHFEVLPYSARRSQDA